VRTSQNSVKRKFNFGERRIAEVQLPKALLILSHRGLGRPALHRIFFTRT
jgi:hypothetical protein